MKSACYFYPILTKTGTGGYILLQLPNIKFHENPFSGSRVVLSVQTEREKQTVRGNLTSLRASLKLNRIYRLI
jgi:hypothetical protein